MKKLTFVGDIFPGDELFTCGFGIRSKTDERSVKRWTKNFVDAVGEADYIIGNLESPLIDDQDAKDKTFYGRPLFAELLKNSGVNILNIANNHILEHGVGGIKKTIGILHGGNILTVGGIEKGHPEILSVEQNGMKICMAGFCDERVCSIENPQCYASLEEAKILNTLEHMKALHPDIIIFIFHWGDEYVHIPTLEQRRLAYKLIDNGANLIVGHHPHVIQPYEHYHNGHIIYSLGNFCFDDVQSDHFEKGMIAKVALKDKTIQDISFQGVLVQDMAYTEELVKPMNHQDFERYFSEINKRYAQLQQLPDDEYQKIYERMQTHSHKKERILMRLSLAKKIIDIRHRHKMQLLKNIKDYIL